MDDVAAPAKRGTGRISSLLVAPICGFGNAFVLAPTNSSIVGGQLN